MLHIRCCCWSWGMQVLKCTFQMPVEIGFAVVEFRSVVWLVVSNAGGDHGSSQLHQIILFSSFMVRSPDAPQLVETTLLRSCVVLAVCINAHVRVCKSHATRLVRLPFYGETTCRQNTVAVGSRRGLVRLSNMLCGHNPMRRGTLQQTWWDYAVCR